MERKKTGTEVKKKKPRRPLIDLLVEDNSPMAHAL